MQYVNPEIDSSYRENNLGETLYDLVLELKPKKIIEFGALNGYSAICMAQALKKLGRGKIESYDLWGQYQFKHSTMTEAMLNAKNYDVSEYIDFFYGDLWSWKPEKADLFHIDISNDGEIIKKASEKLKGLGKVVFEGGSLERDHVEWMRKYNKTPIIGCGVDYEVLNPLFPSISIIK